MIDATLGASGLLLGIRAGAFALPHKLKAFLAADHGSRTTGSTPRKLRNIPLCPLIDFILLAPFLAELDILLRYKATHTPGKLIKLECLVR